MEDAYESTELRNIVNVTWCTSENFLQCDQLHLRSSIIHEAKAVVFVGRNFFRVSKHSSFFFLVMDTYSSNSYLRHCRKRNLPKMVIGISIFVKSCHPA